MLPILSNRSDTSYLLLMLKCLFQGWSLILSWLKQWKIIYKMGLDKISFDACNSEAFPYLCSTIFTGWVPTLLRTGRGMTLWNNAGVVPAEKLELFSYENNSVRITYFLVPLLGVSSIICISCGIDTLWCSMRGLFERLSVNWSFLTFSRTWERDRLRWMRF